jgi:hypothetical protein
LIWFCPFPGDTVSRPVDSSHQVVTIHDFIRIAFALVSAFPNGVPCPARDRGGHRLRQLEPVEKQG